MIKKRILSIIIITALLLVACSNPTENYFTKFESSEYEEALNIYNQDIKGSEVEEEFENELSNLADSLYEKYQNGELEYKEIINRFDQLSKLKLIDEKIKEYIKNIDKIKESRNNFLKGKELINSGRLLDGIEEIEKVIIDDTKNFTTSQELIEENKENLENYIIEKSSGMTNKVSIDYLKKHKDREISGEITEEIDKIINQNTEEKIDEAKLIVENGSYQSYKEAVELFEDNYKYLDSNIIDAKIDEYEELKVEIANEMIDEFKSSVDIEYDDVDKSYYIKPKNFAQLFQYTGLEPNLSIDEENLQMFSIILSTTHNEWIFFDEIIFALDDERVEIDVDYIFKENQVFSYNKLKEYTLLAHTYNKNELAEASDFDTIDDFTLLVENIINSEKSKIRYSGEGSIDHVITTAEKERLKEFWDIYNILYENEKLVEELVN
jgi:hypothetical protein